MQTRRSLLVNTASTALAAGFLAYLPDKASARADIVGKQVPGFYRLKLGNYEITALSDGTVQLPMSKVYRNITEQDAEAYLADRFLSGSTEFPVNAFLVNTGERLVLIDTGSGQLMGPALGQLVANIEASGYTPSQIDDIILTHIHVDHTGGLTVDGKRRFENATVHVNRREQQFWLNADDAAKADKVIGPQIAQAGSSIGPYVEAGKFEVFDDNADPLPGFGSILRAGHTPGHSSFVVESEGEKIVFWGDIVHGHALQYDSPEVTVDFDVDQNAAAASRAIALAEAADQRYLVAGAHNGFPGIGHVRRDETNYDWEPLVYRASY